MGTKKQNCPCCGFLSSSSRSSGSSSSFSSGSSSSSFSESVASSSSFSSSFSSSASESESVGDPSDVDASSISIDHCPCGSSLWVYDGDCNIPCYSKSSADSCYWDSSSSNYLITYPIGQLNSCVEAGTRIEIECSGVTYTYTVVSIDHDLSEAYIQFVSASDGSSDPQACGTTGSPDCGEHKFLCCGDDPEPPPSPSEGDPSSESSGGPCHPDTVEPALEGAWTGLGGGIYSGQWKTCSDCAEPGDVVTFRKQDKYDGTSTVYEYKYRIISIGADCRDVILSHISGGTVGRSVNPGLHHTHGAYVHEIQCCGSPCSEEQVLGVNHEDCVSSGGGYIGSYCWEYNVSDCPMCLNGKFSPAPSCASAGDTFSYTDSSSGITYHYVIQRLNGDLVFAMFIYNSAGTGDMGNPRGQNLTIKCCHTEECSTESLLPGNYVQTSFNDPKRFVVEYKDPQPECLKKGDLVEITVNGCKYTFKCINVIDHPDTRVTTKFYELYYQYNDCGLPVPTKDELLAIVRTPYHIVQCCNGSEKSSSSNYKNTSFTNAELHLQGKEVETQTRRLVSLENPVGYGLIENGELDDGKWKLLANECGQKESPGIAADIIVMAFIDESTPYWSNPTSYAWDGDISGWDSGPGSWDDCNARVGLAQPALEGPSVFCSDQVLRPEGIPLPSWVEHEIIGGSPSAARCLGTVASLNQIKQLFLRLAQNTTPAGVGLVYDGSGSMTLNTIQPAFDEFVAWLEEEYPDMCPPQITKISPTERWVKAVTSMAESVKASCGCEDSDDDPPEDDDPSGEGCICEPVPPWKSYAEIIPLHPGDVERARAIYPDATEDCIVRTCCECSGSSSEESSASSASSSGESSSASSSSSSSSVEICSCCDIKCLTVKSWLHGADGDACDTCNPSNFMYQEPGVSADALACRYNAADGSTCYFRTSSGGYTKPDSCFSATPAEMEITIECIGDCYVITVFDADGGVWKNKCVPIADIIGTHGCNNVTVSNLPSGCTPYQGTVYIEIGDQDDCASDCATAGMSIDDEGACNFEGSSLIAGNFTNFILPIDARTGQPIGVV